MWINATHESLIALWLGRDQPVIGKFISLAPIGGSDTLFLAIYVRTCLDSFHFIHVTISLIMHHYLDVISFLVRHIINSIQAMHHVILRHPLICVLTSLSGNPYYFSSSSEVNLYPLISVVVLRWPCSYVPSMAASIKSRSVGTVEVVPSRWWRHLMILQSVVLQSHWPVAQAS